MRMLCSLSEDAWQKLLPFPEIHIVPPDRRHHTKCPHPIHRRCHCKHQLLPPILVLPPHTH